MKESDFFATKAPGAFVWMLFDRACENQSASEIYYRQNVQCSRYWTEPTICYQKFGSKCDPDVFGHAGCFFFCQTGYTHMPSHRIFFRQTLEAFAHNGPMTRGRFWRWQTTLCFVMDLHFVWQTPTNFILWKEPRVPHNYLWWIFISCDRLPRTSFCGKGPGCRTTKLSS